MKIKRPKNTKKANISLTVIALNVIKKKIFFKIKNRVQQQNPFVIGSHESVLRFFSLR